MYFRGKNRAVIKGIVLVLFLLSAIFLVRYTWVVRYLDPEGLRVRISNFGPWGPIVYILIYSIAPSILIPGTPLTIAGGILFGPIAGIIYTAIGATIGASIAFLISRYMARELAAKLLKHEKLGALGKKVEKQGWKIVAFTRLIPIFPFNFLNYAFGLTGIRFTHYVAASFIFMLPAIIAFVVFSSSLLDLIRGKVSKEFLIGLILLIIISAIPIVYKKIKGGV
ncbi:MAG: TVP38/TMEM64 family protein [Deltaproteobacteria bacterium]|nr:TVP38/TMEM64 family protein [Deltaproteobacteria bacterium]